MIVYEKLLRPQSHTRVGEYGSIICTCALGDRIAITIPDESQPELMIEGNPDNVNFQIKKFGLKPSAPLVIEEARKWVIEATEATLGSSTLLSGVLLGPSIIGKTLYGAPSSPGREIERAFGVIHLLYDRLEKEMDVHILMPVQPYYSIDSLTVSKTHE